MNFRSNFHLSASDGCYFSRTIWATLAVVVFPVTFFLESFQSEVVLAYHRRCYFGHGSAGNGSFC